ncbi:hypothetical protein AQJ30_05975 [Streptomyces longwoodensis]|uniref:Secreted protein n=1 Tax=Streptomyces longwoodensis TaxID=68231 RepID=A0A117QPV9_9ACTN|nr:hypothetical protein [Streptomyces longwoodensis]KUN40229.1 hypothetical protein AQJ30_05975 [Streptomyces longwoodensis]
MKQRGRHRRRRRGRALRAFLAGTALALTAAATMISASQATVTDDPGALEPLARSAVARQARLTEEAVPPGSLDRLTAAMGTPVGVGEVLADADRTLRAAPDCASGERRALPVAPAATRVYCWNADDTHGWQPGAVTTSGDADGDGRWGAHRVVLSGWSAPDHATGGGRLARVAFVDADDPGHLSYTWVLLAIPVEGGLDYRALASHVSGMVWYRNRLLVTADDGDRAGLYVFDLDRVQRAGVAGRAVGRVPGGWSAHGERYVLPAVAAYRLDGGPGAPRPAALSLDRSTTPDSLVAAEWTLPGDGRHARLWRYSLSTVPQRAGLLSTDATGRAEPTGAYETRASGVRGVLARGDTWYVTRPAGSGDERGSLWRQDPDGARAARCGDESTQRCWSEGTPSLSYWEETGEVWTQSGRVLFALPMAALDDAAE